jgi:hypothetical protein
MKQLANEAKAHSPPVSCCRRRPELEKSFFGEGLFFVIQLIPLLNQSAPTLFATIPANPARRSARRQEFRHSVENEFSDKNQTYDNSRIFCGWSGFSGVR